MSRKTGLSGPLINPNSGIAVDICSFNIKILGITNTDHSFKLI